MTYQELKNKLEALTEDQLKQDVYIESPVIGKPCLVNIIKIEELLKSDSENIRLKIINN